MQNFFDQCDFCDLTEEQLSQSGSFLCKDKDIAKFFNEEFANYSHQLLGKSYCFVEQSNQRIVCAFTVANSCIKVDALPNKKRNKINRKIPNEKRRPQYPAVLVGQLAVHQDYKGKHIGNELMDFIKSWFIDPLNKTGCRYVIVDAINNKKVIDYYKDNGFNFIFGSDEEEMKYLQHEKTQSTLQKILHPFHKKATESKIRTRLMFFDLILLSTQN